MKTIITDPNIMYTIIAINMTIIGLTSLADMKSIIGIDYGRFLLTKYKLFGTIRIYYVLVIFAIINIVSIFIIIVNNYEYRFIHFWVLMSSLVFAIYYFFAYIIIENKYIKNRILEQELLGHYIKSEDKTSYNPDIIAKIEDGTRTNKKLSLNVIRFFDKTNTDAEILFEEAFGPKSIIYNRKKQSKMLKQMKMDATPYVYREDTSLVRDISHEFFQLYRYSEAQDRWMIYIANLFRPENEDSKKKSIIYVCNTLRIISQINTFGQSDNLFTYKFMDYFRGDVEFIIMHSTINRTEKAALFEELAIQWTTYMIR